MQNSELSGKLPTSATAVLWSARILTVAILCFWGYFIVAHWLGDAGAASRALTLRDYAGLAMMVTSLVGLGVALKKERLGAGITLAAVAMGALLNWRTLLFPAALIPVTALLFLLAATMPRRGTAIVQQPH